MSWADHQPQEASTEIRDVFLPLTSRERCHGGALRGESRSQVRGREVRRRGRAEAGALSAPSGPRQMSDLSLALGRPERMSN
eukprot:13845443-Alexandrium_andersonii.AAC.1